MSKKICIQANKCPDTDCYHKKPHEGNITCDSSTCDRNNSTTTPTSGGISIGKRFNCECIEMFLDENDFQV